MAKRHTPQIMTYSVCSDLFVIKPETKAVSLQLVPSDVSFCRIFGHERAQGPWKIFSVDVSQVVQRHCVYPDDFVNVTLPVSE